MKKEKRKGETHREPQRQQLSLFNTPLLKIRAHERLQTLRAKIEQLLAVFLFLLFRKAVLGLCDLEFAVALEGDETDAEVGSAWGLEGMGVGRLGR